jgi:hypothetical protein
MNGSHETRKLRIVWVVCIVLTLVMECGVALLLFIPQTDAMEKARRQRREVDDAYLNVQKTNEEMKALSKEVTAGKGSLLESNLFSVQRAEDVVMAAISASHEKVSLVSLNPEKPSPSATAAAAAAASATPTLKAWKLRCTGGFGQLAEFLNKLEQSGLLLDTGQFFVDQTKSGLGMQVIVKTCSAEALAKVMPLSDVEEPGDEKAAQPETSPRSATK